MKRTIYLAGPINGLTYNIAKQHFTDREQLLKHKFNIVYPLQEKNNENENSYNNSLSSDSTITKLDLWRVQISDIIYADFTYATKTVSIGTVAEIAKAHTLGKLIVTVLPKNNLHNHAFIKEMSSVIFDTNKDAINFLEKV